jgi:hypothetical protein
VVISNSPGWTCHLHCCDFVWISGVKLLGNIFGPNTDGFDINGCRDVMIANCYIECGDDAICLKTSKDARSCERVTAANCVIRTHCVGFKCGSESFHDFRQIAFSNSVVFRSTRAFGLYCFDGGTIEDVVVSNIVCDTDSGFILNRPIHLDLRKRDVETTLVPMDQQKIGRIRNVQVSNFVARTDGRLLMTAADGGVLENVLLRDIRMSIPAYDDPDPVARGAKSAQFSNHSPDARPARAIVVAENMKNFVLDGLQIDWPDGQDDPNWGGAKMENGSDRVIEPSHARPDFHVVWGKNLRGGMLNVPLAQTNREGVKKFVLIDSDIRHE